MEEITHRRIAPAGSISQIAQDCQDFEVDWDEAHEAIDFVARHRSVPTPQSVLRGLPQPDPVTAWLERSNWKDEPLDIRSSYATT